MADIAAAGVTYTDLPQRAELTGGSKLKTIYQVAFGDGTDTYPSGGVPLTKAKLGCPNAIESVNMVEDSAGDGYVYKYDDSAEKLRIYWADFSGTAAGALTELTGGATAVAAATLTLEVTGW